jgi:ribosomal protein S18 acetylase RimI-like enzyme
VTLQAATSISAIELRRATAADAQVLAEIGRDTFTETFGHLYSAEDLAAFIADGHQPAHYAAWAENPDYALWLALRGGRAVGYALAGPCGLPHPEVTPGCGELKRIYVRAEAQGAALGSRLLAAAFDWLERPGRMLWIGVWSENAGAQRLYARHGYDKVGEYLFPVGETRDQEFILRRTVPAG